MVDPPRRRGGWVAGQADGSSRLSLGITEDGADRALGRVSLRFSDGEVGYWLVPAARGRGLASRAVRLLAAHARDALNITELRLEIEPDNEPSLRVAAAVGARPTGERVTEADRSGVQRELLRFRL